MRRKEALLEVTATPTVRSPKRRQNPHHGNNTKYVALVIGSNNYQHFESLETAINDARAVAGVLEKSFGFEVQLLEDPSRYELVGALAQYRQSLTETDSFLLYYAGHDYLDPLTQRGYWLPVDAEESNPSNWVSTTEISDALLSFPVQRALVITDSCYSGSLANGETPAYRPQSSPDLGRSRTVITSGGLEPVLDSNTGDHSVFAKALLDQLKHYEDGTALSDIFERIRHEVQRYAEQTPEYAVIQDSGHESGEFVLHRLDAG
jgi:uncharacterized caspase-like protein